MNREIHLDDAANELHLGDILERWLSVYAYGGDDIITFSSAPDDVYLYGGDGRDYLRAGDGRGISRLDGGDGPDTMIGGNGMNFFSVDRAGDKVVDETRDDYDFVRSTISYRLNRNLENLNLEGSGDTRGEGNGLDNIIWGSLGDNLILGKAGDDTIDVRYGRSRDTIVGGLGADTLSAWYTTRFVYEDVSESNLDHGVDSIHGWRERNKIDLRAIDANPATPDVDDRFVFIGTEAFGADATGQVRYEVVGPNRCAILVSTDADADAEMRIDLLRVLPVADIFAL